jgi:GNAT superfamily N-acetyltransferase
MKSGSYYLFVAEEGGKIVGFTSFSINLDPAMGEVHAVGRHIYVEPEYRKGKVGSLLHKENLRCAKEQGAKAWVLMCTNNEKSVWIKKGFEPMNQNLLIKKLEV